MKKYLRPKYLPLITVVAGLLGFFLRLWTLGSGPDREGLYAPQPAAWTLLWIVTAATLAAIILLTARLKNPGRYTDNFPASPISAVGTALAAVAIMSAGLKMLFSAGGLLTSITGILGVAAAVCMVLAAFARYRGQRSSFLLHAMPCLFFALRIFDRCKDWSNEPQTSVFLFPFLASICVMLASYQLASFDVDLGKRRQSLFWSLSGVYFCMVALPGGDDMLFYGCMAIWLLTNLCSLRLLKVRKPQPNAESEPSKSTEFMEKVNQEPDAALSAQPDSILETDVSLDELKDWLDNN